MGSPGREHVAAGRRAIVKFYSLKRYATDESKALEMTAPLLPSSSAAVVDKCAATPTICGHGKCVSVQTGYTCRCDPGFKLSALQTNCIGKISALSAQSRPREAERARAKRDLFVYVDLLGGA